jgi:hypothetical protein
MSEFCSHIAKERNCSPELVRAVLTDCIAQLHETSFKKGLGQALVDAYWELSPLGAWHFMGLLCEAAESEPGEIIEHYQRLDSTLKRFSTIIDRWKFELEQEQAQRQE